MILLCLASSTTPRRRNLLVALAQYSVTHFRSSSTKPSSWFLSSLLFFETCRVQSLVQHCGFLQQVDTCSRAKFTFFGFPLQTTDKWIRSAKVGSLKMCQTLKKTGLNARMNIDLTNVKKSEGWTCYKVGKTSSESGVLEAAVKMRENLLKRTKRKNCAGDKRSPPS